MDEREFQSQIRRLWTFLSAELAIGKFLISQDSLGVDEQFRDVAIDPESLYEQIYRVGLSRSHYNILLNDYSYFQFSRDGDENWRLAYWPNPWITGAPEAADLLARWEAREEAGISSHEETSELIAGMQYLGAVPPIRFENAPAQYRELVHPSAHLHIGRHDQNRWPSAVSLGPTAFGLIIAKLYYPQAWASRSNLQGAGVAECIDEALLNAMANVRFVHNFSEIESRSFHFGKNMLRGQSGVFTVYRDAK